MLAEMLGDRREGDKAKGVFYLCGPTWPVPDVYEALLGALGEYGGYSRDAAAEHIESLKEEERYVLEVCFCLLILPDAWTYETDRTVSYRCTRKGSRGQRH